MTLERKIKLIELMIAKVKSKNFGKHVNQLHGLCHVPPTLDLPNTTHNYLYRTLIWGILFDKYRRDSKGKWGSYFWAPGVKKRRIEVLELEIAILRKKIRARKKRTDRIFRRR